MMPLYHRRSMTSSYFTFRWYVRICTRTAFIIATLTTIMFITEPSSLVQKDSGEKLILKETLHKIVNANDRILVYNRVPKCGSTFLISLFDTQQRTNNIKVYWKGYPFKADMMTNVEQVNMTKHIYNSQTTKPVMHILHMYFLDFQKHNLKQPMYINIVRDPIQRFQSHYYFLRYGNKMDPSPKQLEYRSEEERYESIDDCVRNRRMSCVTPLWRTVPYFCGHDPRCLVANEWAVNRAKSNIVRYYVVIGVTEYLNETLDVLSMLLPRYFANVNKMVYDPKHKHLNKMRNGTMTVNNTPMSVESQTFLKHHTRLKYEYELYNFIVERLFQLKNSINS